MRRFASVMLANVIFFTALLVCGTVFAQSLNDPMRPPAGFTEGDAEAPSAAGGPVLQSVVISPTLRAAIISGEMVKLGGKFGSARLVKISESEVVLKDGDETQVLKMYPGVEKRDVARKTAKSARHAPAAAPRSAAGGTAN